MRAHSVALALVLCGCSVNEDALRAVQAAEEKRLVEQMALADNLNERRKDIDVLELKLKALGADVEIDLAPPPATPAPLPLPLESPLEDGDAQRLRRQIADTRQRIAQLDKILLEVGALEQRKKAMEARLRELEAASAQPPPAP